jgi:hypothetical protein
MINKGTVAGEKSCLIDSRSGAAMTDNYFINSTPRPTKGTIFNVIDKGTVTPGRSARNNVL